ncbi:acyltransferase [Spirosoma aureum]|uniref:Acyltransferase n=1 Tax=Spirosoma aureum TaxID=2692134 RepID=A0A6G9AX22_9BACT|nr:acyltransferase [Spirosoma aureum]QIP16889.1 acyltransferase [Spirosoma aureum]
MLAVNVHPSNSVGRYVPALTGLRAVAAYLVFLHHYNPVATDRGTHQLIAQGYMGVTVFFVLSGFLIYHRYAESYFSRTHWSWHLYYQNRFARIVPLYTLLLLLTSSISIAQGKPAHWFDFVLNLTLAKGFFEPYKFSGIAQSWSLTVEECFYLTAPWLFVLLRRWGPLLLTATLVSLGLFLWLTIGALNWHGLFGSFPFVLFYTFFGRSFEFVTGMWLAQRWHQDKFPRIREVTYKGLLLLCSCLGWQTYIICEIKNSEIQLGSEVVVYNFILPVGIGLLLLGLVQEPSGLQRFLAHPAMQALGRSSYAFYLIHIGVIARLVQRTVSGSNSCVLFALLVLIAHSLYTWIEKPLQRKLRSG